MTWLTQMEVCPHRGGGHAQGMTGPHTLADVLRDAAQGRRSVALVDEPDQPAEPLAPLSALRAATLAEAMAAGLDALGVSPRGAVALVAPNAARAIVTALAVPASGRLLVLPDPAAGVEELHRALLDRRTELVLADPEVADRVTAAAPTLRRLELGAPSDAALFRFDRPGTTPAPAAADPAVVLGTGEELTHAQLLGRAGVQPGGWLLLAPLSKALPLVVAAWRTGARLVMMRKPDGLEALGRVVEHGIGTVVVDRAAVWSLLAVTEEEVGTLPTTSGVRLVAVEQCPAAELEQLRRGLGWQVEQARATAAP